MPAGRGLLATSSSSGGLLSSQGLARPQYAQQIDQQPVARPAAAPAAGDRGLFSSQIFGQSQYAQQAYQQPAASERGLFAARSSAPPAYAQRGLLPTSVLQYRAPRASTPQYASPQYDAGASYAAAPRSYASASYEQPYMLGAGDKLRVVVFGQDGISNTYIVDAGGNVSLPLIGSVPAHGITAQQLSQRIAERLKQGYVREPHVTVEVETYRPFFMLGEVTTPGQYPYVADMTVEKAIAIAGGFALRADKKRSNSSATRPANRPRARCRSTIRCALAIPCWSRNGVSDTGAAIPPQRRGTQHFVANRWISAFAGMTG